jgi:hypothetical protein
MDATIGMKQVKNLLSALSGLLSKLGGNISGYLTVGNPTGGSKGTGTINAEGVYINGESVAAAKGTQVTFTDENLTVKPGFQYIVLKGLNLNGTSEVNVADGGELVIVDELASFYVDSAMLTSGSMLLVTLTKTPKTEAEMRVSLNGVMLDYGVHYTVTGGAVVATLALNEALGGIGTNGLGFDGDDRVVAQYQIPLE